jgi:hypothetical protein
MRGRTVHHVYAEDDQPVVSYEEPPIESYDEQPTDSYDRPPTESHEYPPAQLAWRVRRPVRVVAMALLGAAIAFVVVFAIHALTRPAMVVGPREAGRVGSQSAPEQTPTSAAVLSRHGASQGARNTRHVLASARGTSGTGGATAVRQKAFGVPSHRVTPRQRSAVALRGEEHTIARFSTIAAAPVAPARVAESEFTFER